MRRALWIIFAVIIVLSTVPFWSVLWADWFAKRHGCVLHEGFATECLVNGQDWGVTLYGAFTAGWFALITLPIGAAALLGMVILALTALWHRRRR